MCRWMSAMDFIIRGMLLAKNNSKKQHLPVDKVAFLSYYKSENSNVFGDKHLKLRTIGSR